MLALLAAWCCCCSVTCLLTTCNSFAGSLVAQLTAVSEKVDSMHSRLQHKVDKDGLQEAKQQLNSVRQQGQLCSQLLADLKGTSRQQGQEQATALNRLEALITTCAHGRAKKQHSIHTGARKGVQAELNHSHSALDPSGVHFAIFRIIGKLGLCGGTHILLK